MDIRIPSMQRLTRLLQQIPYLASRNVHKVAEFLLTMSTDKREAFLAALQGTCAQVELCSECYCWKEKSEGCALCQDATRHKNIICVIESWGDVCAIERSSAYRGVYHVLGGLLSPLDGIGPEDIYLRQLVERVSLIEGRIEIILAFNQTPEGEATGAYVSHMLKSRESVTLSCLARGLPVGSSLEYMDRLTLHKALVERRVY